MGYLIKDRMEVSIFFNDIEYPLSAINVLNFLHIGVVARYRFPTICFSITDVERVLDRIGIQDGIPIRVVIKPNGGESITYNFRKFNHKQTFVDGSYTYDIDGYIASPLWVIGTRSASIKGTSSVVLQQIAAECGFRYDGTVTNDSQLWLPQNLTNSSFAKKVAKHGYVSDTSCMALALDLSGILRYKDVNNLPAASTKIVAYQRADNAYTAIDFRPAATSGFNNNRTGYNNSRVKQSIVDDAIQQTYSKVDVSINSRSPLFNTVVKESAAKGGVRYGMIDVGNTHTNYDRAVYQNVRYRNLFSLNLEVLLDTLAYIPLLSKVNFSVEKEDLKQDVAYSGEYVVTGRAIYVQGSTYSEKLILSRHGTNEQYKVG